MASYLDNYGVADQKRSKRIKWIAIPILAATVLGSIGYLYFRNFSEERTAKRFMQALRSQDFQGAYQIWGCTPQSPCRDYAFEKFMEDWGPKGVYPNPQAAKITIVDSCGAGVVFTMNYPNTDPFGVYVDRGTKTFSFFPHPRCPGRHWHFWDFVKSKIG